VIRFLFSLAIVAVVAAASVGTTVASAKTTRSCGTLAIGIGWHLRASPNVTCRAARRLMTVYFGRRRPARAVVLEYVCTRRDLPDAEHIRCVHGTRLVAAKSFGY
jgi:hypothetical protein